MRDKKERKKHNSANVWAIAVILAAAALIALFFVIREAALNKADFNLKNTVDVCAVAASVFVVVSMVGVLHFLRRERLLRENVSKDAEHKENSRAILLPEGADAVLYEHDLSADKLLNVSGNSELLGYETSAVCFNERTEEFLRFAVHPDFRAAFSKLLNRERLLASYYEGKSEESLDFISVGGAGVLRWLRLSVALARPKGKGSVTAYLLFEDIDKNKRMELEQKEKSVRDTLTGVLDRFECFERINSIIGSTAKGGGHALCVVTVTNLRSVNEALGNVAGDGLLSDVASCLKAVARKDDIIGRIGGNKFCLLLRDFDFKAAINKKLVQFFELAEKKRYGMHTARLCAGITLFPDDGETADELFSRAEAALRFTCTYTDDRYRYYDAAMRDEATERTKALDGGSTQKRAKKTMLIVDDSELSRELLSEMFKNDFEIITAETGIGALDVIESRGSGIAIVLLDVMMNDISGLDVLSRMGESVELSTIPVIIISAGEEEEFSTMAIRYGALDFVRKPIDPETVKLKVKNAVIKSENDKLRIQNSYLALQGEEENKYRNVLLSTGTIVCEVDWANRLFSYDFLASERLSGSYDGRALWEIFKEDGVSSAADAEHLREVIASVAENAENRFAQFDITLLCADGNNRWYRATVSRGSGADRKLYITLNDVNDEVISNIELRRIAEYDTVTGLFNRSGFSRRASALIKSAAENSYVIGYFDIDKFKFYNDVYGFEHGNEVLCYVAQKLGEYIKRRGVCSRLSADCFAICMPNGKKNIEGLIKCYNESKSFDKGGTITASFGFYVVDDKELSVDAMIDRAAMAQKKVKGNIHKIYDFYDDDIREKLLRERDITNIMTQALENGEFCFYLQPQYRLEDNAVVGAEALARWRSEARGVIPPGMFVPIFEKNGFIIKLDVFIWEAVCKQIREWLDKGIKAPHLSVNISRYDIMNMDVCAAFLAFTKKYQIPTELLRLEITESAYSDDPGLIIDCVKTLQAHGFIVEMDDFGSGYSSLNVLKDVDFNVVKLDMQFLAGEEDEKKKSILSSVIKMAKNLGLEIIAEGVETWEQASYLKSMGCDIAQGYLFARPMPPEDFEKLILGG